jgi:hypothetical protein
VKAYLRASHCEITAWLTRASCPTCTWDSLFVFIIRETRSTMSASEGNGSSSGAFFFPLLLLLLLLPLAAPRAGEDLALPPPVFGDFFLPRGDGITTVPRPNKRPNTQHTSGVHGGEPFCQLYVLPENTATTTPLKCPTQTPHSNAPVKRPSQTPQSNAPVKRPSQMPLSAEGVTEHPSRGSTGITEWYNFPVQTPQKTF